ncbi:regulatory LuxR family protein [Bradyrhizobium sp. R2.2-H]|uniref:helix-turn-helix transcriptional regulator n=1 Tax=unclassified Bradyrhizobium TaxID=2631580 RepID=UPI00104982B4|nr:MULTISPECIES: LuxR C-terminal-related transcriptional regulator [unclassified Bradyrhizobium]TCU64346.1 regulatory LuxR family protein [Bradyrhizobium sp. Y-H1]TCU66270.1 regulatory LuxR family protein [Bradyrhizobium sp. R2.2-H]
MRAKQEQLDGLPEGRLADRLMSIAESRSVRALGVACCSAITELTGSPTVGLYLLDGVEPALVYSRYVADGLLDNYKAGFWKHDPVLDCIMTRGCAVDGETVIGPQHWRHSPTFEMLHEWGFAYNMGGPLWCGQKIIGVLFTATTETGAPYTPRARLRMEMLCRAGSLALTNMMNAGEIETHRRPSRPAGTLSASLPPRSADVAIRVCRGQTNKEIAREMGISDQTVKEHVANLCRRFGVHNRTELAACLLSARQ